MTMVEVIVASVILLCVGSGLMVLMQSITKSSAHGRFRLQALALIQNEIELLKSYELSSTPAHDTSYEVALAQRMYKVVRSRLDSSSGKVKNGKNYYSTAEYQICVSFPDDSLQTPLQCTLLQGFYHDFLKK